MNANYYEDEVPKSICYAVGMRRFKLFHYIYIILPVCGTSQEVSITTQTTIHDIYFLTITMAKY